MDTAEGWRALFENWPESLPKEGIIVTSFGESIPFVNFMLSAGILLVERDRPDSSNARKIMISYNAIEAVKSTSPMELARFQVMGFQAPL